MTFQESEKETDGDRFETMRSLNQELTFEAAKKEFSRRKVDFGPQQMRTLQMEGTEGIYSNLAMLLSDQCIHTIKVAVFQGTDQSVFKDRKEFCGSLLRQMNDIYAFIDFRNQTSAAIEGLFRRDVRDYPEVAVREALMNLLVHRDYSFSASAFISVFDDRIEFTSIGRLMPGLDLEDVLMGISVCRNQNLANVFYRLQLIEAYGTGLGKIMKAYEATGKEPTVEVTKHAFKIALPNINTKDDKYGPFAAGGQLLEEEVFSLAEAADSAEAKILAYAEAHREVTRIDAEDLLGVSSSTATRLLRKLHEAGKLKKLGKTKGVKYII